MRFCLFRHRGHARDGTVETEMFYGLAKCRFLWCDGQNLVRFSWRGARLDIREASHARELTYQAHGGAAIRARVVGF